MAATVCSNNNALIEAVKQGHIDEIQKYTSCPDVRLDKALVIAGTFGHMEIVKTLMHYNIEKRLVFLALHRFLNRPTGDLTAFTQVLDSDFWEHSDKNIRDLLNNIILRDNVEAFKIFLDKIPFNIDEYLISSARHFSTKIFLYLLNNVTTDINVYRDLLEHISYGFYSTFEQGYLDSKNHFVKRPDRTQMKTANRPIYDDVLRQLRPRVNLVSKKYFELLEKSQIQAMNAIKRENKYLQDRYP